MSLPIHTDQSETDRPRKSRAIYHYVRRMCPFVERTDAITSEKTRSEITVLYLHLSQCLRNQLGDFNV